MSLVSIAPAQIHRPAGLAVRRARLDDLPGLSELIRHYADQAILLPLTPEDLRKKIKNFYIISDKNRTLACGALRYYTPTAAEVRSLAVVPGYRGSGLGRQIVETLVRQARRRGLEMLFAFTYAVPFFTRLGFVTIDRDLVPWKAWNDCVICPKRECCDETAVALWLRPSSGRPGLNHKI